ncbi:hypothetical protein [Bacillus sp. 1P06AnD]
MRKQCKQMGDRKWLGVYRPSAYVQSYEGDPYNWLLNGAFLYWRVEA